MGNPICGSLSGRLIGVKEADHIQKLDKVLTSLEESGLGLRGNKCTFMQDEVGYLGSKVDIQGLYPVRNQVKAIDEANTLHKARHT